MKTKELIVQEMEAVSEPILAEVLDFLKFLKAKSNQLDKQVTVVSASGEEKVSLATLAMQDPEVAKYLTAVPVPVQQMCDELKKALTDGGYTSREDIIDLVKEVKLEMLAERDAQQIANHA